MEYLRYVLLSLLLLSTLPAWGGTYIRSAIKSHSDDNDWLFATLTIDQGKLRADIQAPDLEAIEKAAKGKTAPDAAAATQTYTLLYDKAASRIDLVVPAEKSAYEFTKTDMKELKAVLSVLSIELDRFMEDPKATEEKNRLAWEKSKKDGLSSLSPGPAVRDRVSGRSCDKYSIRFDGVKWMDLWCLPPGRTPIPLKDFQTAQSMTASFVGLFADFLGLFNVTPKRFLQHPLFHDFLMQWTSYDEEGEPKETYRILEIRSKDCPTDTFEIPAGYKKTDIHDFVMHIPKRPGEKDEEEKNVEGGMTPSQTPEPDDP